jgi:hypothetical protein
MKQIYVFLITSLLCLNSISAQLEVVVPFMGRDCRGLLLDGHMLYAAQSERIVTVDLSAQEPTSEFYYINSNQNYV